MNIFFQHLNDPEYIHVLLNPMPVYGLSIGTLALVLALFLRHQRVTIAALVLVFVSALSAWPVYHYGEAGYDRVKAVSDPAGEQWLDEHMARAEKMIWLFYVLAAVSAGGVAVVAKWPRFSTAASITALALASSTLGIGGWISYPAGHVRHKEFRFEPPPVAKSDGHTHTHGSEEGGHAQAMDHGSMPGMTPSTSSDAKVQPMQHDASQQPAAPTQEQLEASRMQLEASRLQLEASRKQLEATEAAKTQTASPSATQTPPPHTEEGHQHEPPKP